MRLALRSKIMFCVLFISAAYANDEQYVTTPAKYCPNLKFWRFPVIDDIDCNNSYCDILFSNDLHSNAWVVQARFPAQPPYTKSYGLTGRPFFYTREVDMVQFTWKPLIENSGSHINEVMFSAVAHLPKDLNVEVLECHYTSKINGQYIPLVAKLIENYY